MKLAEIHLLHKSDFYQIRDYKCNCLECHTSGIEFNQGFNLCFIRSGYFEYQVFRKALEVHVGRVLVSKPYYEHRTRHIENQPDLCTVFDFTSAFYELVQDNYEQDASWFFNNKDLHSLLVQSSPDLDHLHFILFQEIQKPFRDTLLIDDWVIRLVDKVMQLLGAKPNVNRIASGLKHHHLSTVEKAKNFIITHYSENISLQEIAQHCCVSMFHFCHIFKSIMKISPYQYLKEVRLHNAQLLLSGSNLPITQIAFQCGFNSLEQFDSIFRQRFQTSPSAFKTVR